jgi:outer membrane protein assembly factor BamD (BamD/ComL family)
MDGAYREYVHGVIAGQRTFVRVKDFDADKSDQKDKVMLRIYAQYKAATNELEAVTEVTQESEPEYAIRDTLDLTLEETEPHSGFFAGMLMVEDSKNPAAVNKSDAKLEAVEKDQIVMEYVDKEHFGGLDTPRTATARAAFLTGQIQDVAIAHREADTEDLRARKNLIEAKFYLRLATIFKDVGLVARAKEKADVGLEKADDILRRSVRASLDQDLIEEAYRLKWELQLAKGDMASAINTCYLLMSLYPTSSLADVALLQIAKARIEAKQTQDALQILSGLLQLKGNPDLKAEAQFLIASVLEENVNKKLPKEERLRAMGQAIDAYRACADKYPGSPFAGQALGKVIDFHIESRDYNRCLELLQTVFTDFPDASFLDEMLLKWGVVLAQMQRYSDSLEKLQQVINEYPNSTAASKATKVLDVVSKKVK